MGETSAEIQTPRRPKASGRFEVSAWFFMRLSGLMLAILVLVHFGIMHLQYGVMRIDFDTIVARWQTPFWRLFDLTMLCLGVVHGLVGGQIVINDYIHPRGARIAALSVAWTAGLIILAMGIFTIVTFRWVR